VGHREIADELWDGEPPTSWVTSLKALVSRTRAALAGFGIDGGALLVGAPGMYRFWPPSADLRARHATLLAHAG
jgi:hypothetical protein